MKKYEYKKVKKGPVEEHWLTVAGNLQYKMESFDMAQHVLRKLNYQAAEIERLKGNLNDIEDAHRAVMEEPCDDEKHCTCVPVLRREIERQYEEIKQLRKLPTYEEADVHAWIWEALTNGGCDIPYYRKNRDGRYEVYCADDQKMLTVNADSDVAEPIAQAICNAGYAMSEMNEEIERLKAENAKLMTGEIKAVEECLRLQESLRWRKWPEERPEKEGQYIVSYTPQESFKSHLRPMLFIEGKWNLQDTVTVNNWLPIPSCPQRQEDDKEGEW
jgi:hypothetical protein